MAFDIDKFTSTSVNVNWNDLDFEEFKTHPLPEATLRALRYMCDVEYHTVCYLRDMLVTPSHKDEEVSAFMTKSYPQVGLEIRDKKVMSKEVEEALKTGIAAFKATPAGAPTPPPAEAKK